MKQFLCPFPKILVFLILGLVNFNFTANAQLPAKKKTIVYDTVAEVAYVQVCSDLKAQKDIFNCPVPVWLQQICDNAVLQGYAKTTPSQMLYVILDPNQTSLKWLTPEQVINMYLLKGVFVDCIAQQAGWYVCVGDCILFRLGPTNCLNPCRMKNKYPTPEPYVSSIQQSHTPASTPTQQPTITPIEENDYVVVKEEITPEEPPIQTQGNQSGTVVNNIKIRNNNNDWSGFWGAVGQIGSAFLYSSMGQQCGQQPIIQTNPRQCPVGQHWVPYPRDPRNGRCVNDVTYGTGGLPSTNPGTVGNGGLPGTTTGTTTGNGGLPGTGNGGLPGTMMRRR